MNDPSHVPCEWRLRAAVTLAGLLILAACATTPPPPIANLSAARSAIGDAEKAGAGQYATAELGEARVKLAAADSAVEKNSMLTAQRLADQSRVEAELASAKTTQAKATAVNKDMKQSNDTLVEEMQRKAGSQP